MKKLFLLAALGLAALGALAQTQGQFNIRATIPGLKAGTEINLVGRDAYGHEDLATTTAEDGSFALSGTVAQPTLAEVRIEIPEMEIAFRMIIF